MTQIYNDLKRENLALHEQLKKQQAEVERLKQEVDNIKYNENHVRHLRDKLKAHEAAMREAVGVLANKDGCGCLQAKKILHAQLKEKK